VVGGDLKILSTASVGGDLIVYGTSVDMAGTVGRNIHGSAETVRIDGVVEGEINLTVSNLTLGERAEVSGNLTYLSTREVIRAPGASVQGQILKKEVTTDSGNFKDIVIIFLVVLFSALAGHLFFRRAYVNVLDQAEKYTLRNFVIGLGFVIVTPLVSIILLFSTLGSIIGGLLLCVYIAIMLASVIIIPPLLGLFLNKNILKRSGELSVALIISGVFLVMILLFVPIIGPGLVVFLWILASGSLAVFLYRLLRNS
jgi:cytoskeletal protein CcmA (bactofilin family)